MKCQNKLTAAHLGNYVYKDDEGNELASYRVVEKTKTSTGVPLAEVGYEIEFQTYPGAWDVSGYNRDYPLDFLQELEKEN